MATNTTHNIYLPKDLIGPLARYMVETKLDSMSKLVQLALREKLQREGYIEPGADRRS